MLLSTLDDLRCNKYRMMNYKYVLKEDCNKYLTELLYKMKLWSIHSHFYISVFSQARISLSLSFSHSLLSHSQFSQLSLTFKLSQLNHAITLAVSLAWLDSFSWTSLFHCLPTDVGININRTQDGENDAYIFTKRRQPD